MSTRGAVGWVLDKKYYAFYNHFDSYPEGLGKDVVSFLLELIKEEKIERFKKYVEKMRYVKDSPSLDKQKQGAELLEDIVAGRIFKLVANTDFLNDSLFCEYAYIINLDDMSLELFKGFQTTPQKGNPFGCRKQKGNDYYPVARVGKIKFENFPMEIMESINGKPYEFLLKYFKED